jgi:hypothetical protein
MARFPAAGPVARATTLSAEPSSASSLAPGALLGALTLVALTAAPGLAAPPPSPRPVACLPEGGPLQLQRLFANSLELCVVEQRGTGKLTAAAVPTCLTLAIDPGYLSPSSRPFQPPSQLGQDANALEVGEQSVEVCGGAAHSKAGDCKTFTAAQAVDPGLGLTAALSADGARVALAYLGARPAVEVFDVVSGRRLFTLAGRERKAPCISADFIGESLLIRERDCGEDAFRATWLVDANGQPLADAGGARTFASPLDPVRLTDELWAFLSARGDAVVLQNVKTGKVEKRLSLGAKVPAAQAAAMSAISDDTRLMIAHAGKRRGELSLLDVATGKLRKLSLKRCKK